MAWKPSKRCLKDVQKWSKRRLEMVDKQFKNSRRPLKMVEKWI